MTVKTTYTCNLCGDAVSTGFGIYHGGSGKISRAALAEVPNHICGSCEQGLRRLFEHEACDQPRKDTLP